RDPESLPALQTLAEALLALGDARAARDAAQRAVQLDDRNARSRALLGDAYAGMGDRAGAEEQYRRSLLLRPDPAVQRKLEDVGPAPARPAQGAQFRIRYDGGVNEPLGVAVLDVLTKAHAEYARRLGFRPEDPVVVLLMMETGIPEGRVPEWAAGVNDGTIRVPLRGLDRLTPRLTTVLRHELAHSFIAARTGGNCPTWLQEGVSQWLEGGDPNREDATVAALARPRARCRGACRRSRRTTPSSSPGPLPTRIAGGNRAAAAPSTHRPGCGARRRPVPARTAPWPIGPGPAPSAPAARAG